MIANFFNKTKPIQAIFIFGLFILYYILAIFTIEHPILSWVLLLKKAAGLALFLVVFFLIRFINRKNNLSGQNSYVLLLFAIIYGIFPKTMEIQPIFMAHFFLLLAFRRIYSIKSIKNIKEKIFDSGLWIGIAALFYIWSVLFLLLIYAAIISYKKQEIRVLIIPIIGLITPIFITFTYYFITDDQLLFYTKLIFQYSITFETISLAAIILCGLSITGITMISLKINSTLFDLKPSWALIVIHFFIALISILFAPIKEGAEYIFIFFPLVIILTNYLQSFDKTYFKEIIVIGLLALSISVYLT